MDFIVTAAKACGIVSADARSCQWWFVTSQYALPTSIVDRLSFHLETLNPKRNCILQGCTSIVLGFRSHSVVRQSAEIWKNVGNVVFDTCCRS